MGGRNDFAQVPNGKDGEEHDGKEGKSVLTFA